MRAMIRLDHCTDVTVRENQWIGNFGTSVACDAKNCLTVDSDVKLIKGE